MRKYTIRYRHTGFTVPDCDDIYYIGREAHRNRVPFIQDDERTIEVPDTARLLANGDPNAALERAIRKACWHTGADPAEIDPDTVWNPEDYQWWTAREILAIEDA